MEKQKKITGYVTKYWETHGIVKCDDMEPHWNKKYFEGYVVKDPPIVPPVGHGYCGGPEYIEPEGWRKTKKEAIAQVTSIKDEVISALEKMLEDARGLPIEVKEAPECQ